MALLLRKTGVFFLWGGFSILFVGALWHQNNILSILLALLVSGLLSLWFFREWNKVAKESRWTEGLFFSLGAALTLGLYHYTPMDNIAAASLVGLGSTTFLKKFETPLYAGAFLGMSSAFFMAPIPFLFTLALGGAIYVFVAPYFNGLGGKLGFLAWMTALTSARILNQPLIEETVEISLIGLWILSMIGVFLTAALVQKALLSNVLASSVVGLSLAALVFFFPQMGIYAAAAYGATFIGMSSAERIPYGPVLLVAGTFYTLIFYFMMPYFPGLGGKLGAMAFVSTAMTYTLLQWVKRRLEASSSNALKTS